jgi:hypothetical protein
MEMQGMLETRELIRRWGAPAVRCWLRVVEAEQARRAGP